MWCRDEETWRSISLCMRIIQVWKRYISQISSASCWKCKLSWLETSPELAKGRRPMEIWRFVLVLYGMITSQLLSFVWRKNLAVGLGVGFRDVLLRQIDRRFSKHSQLSPLLELSIDQQFTVSTTSKKNRCPKKCVTDGAIRARYSLPGSMLIFDPTNVVTVAVCNWISVTFVGRWMCTARAVPYLGSSQSLLNSLK